MRSARFGRRRSARRRAGIGSGLLLGLVAFGLTLAPLARAAQAMTVTADKSQVGLLVPTTVQVTVTNVQSPGGDDFACIRITVPNAYTLTTASLVSVSNGGTWSVTRVGKVMTARAASRGDALRGDPTDDAIVVSLTVTGKTVSGAAWTVESRSETDCSGDHRSVPLKMAVVVAAPTPTPTPTPIPTPTRRPTPVPTLRPTPVPTPTPAGPPTATPTPTPAQPTPAQASPAPSGSPASSAPPSIAPTPSGVPLGGGPIAIVPLPSDRPGRTTAQPFGPPLSGTDVSLSGMGLDALGMLGPFIVPGFVAAASGLLLLLILLLQAGGAAIWLPIVRRRIGDFRLGSRRRSADRG